jgi:hypothetical protein
MTSIYYKQFSFIVMTSIYYKQFTFIVMTSIYYKQLQNKRTCTILITNILIKFNDSTYENIESGQKLSVFT